MRQYVKQKDVDAAGGKVCSRCGEFKPADEFGQRQSQCKPCRVEIESSRYEHNKEQMRNRSRERKFGISPVQYAKMLAEQSGVCAICEQPETNTYRGEVRALSVDHDHDTGIVRGLLCFKCNSRLHEGDFADWAARAARYLG